MKKVALLLFTLLNYSLYSQTVSLYSDDFESGENFTYVQTAVNTWRVATCAGNGVSDPGTNALYASKGGSTPGCGTDGMDQYAFSAAPPSTTERMTAYVPVDGKCTNNHAVTFDYKLNPADASNRAFVVYSLNGGAFWFVQDTLVNAASWTTITVPLDEATYNQDFLVGVRFEYSNVSGNGDPFAVDNFEVNGIAAKANIPLDTMAVCGQTTIVVTADPYHGGAGNWFLLSGQGTFNNAAANQTGVNNLAIGQSVFTWTVTSPDCGNSVDTIVIINSLAPSNANVQDTFYACVVQQLNISTSAPMAGTGTWTSPQGATIANPNSPATVVTNVPNGWSQLIWTISSPGCPSKADTMDVFKTGGQSILTADTTICLGTDTELIITATPTDSLQSVSWLFGMGNGMINELSADSVEISGLQTGENHLIYEVTHALCPKESDTLRIYIMPCEDFEPVFPTVITPNGDGKNDLFIINNLEKVYPECQMTIFNRHGSIVYESPGYTTPWDGTFKGEKLPMGTYFFKLELNDGSNTIYNGPISIIH